MQVGFETHVSHKGKSQLINTLELRPKQFVNRINPIQGSLKSDYLNFIRPTWTLDRLLQLPDNKLPATVISCEFSSMYDIANSLFEIKTEALIEIWPRLNEQDNTISDKSYSKLCSCQEK